MNNLKAERERTKEIEENQQQQQLLLSRTSKVCCGAFEMSLVYDAAAVMSMTPKQANDWVRYMDEVGWCFTNGNDVTSKNFRRSLRMWMKMSEKIEKRASRIRKRNCADAVDYEALAKERAEAKRREKAKDPRGGKVGTFSATLMKARSSRGGESLRPTENTALERDEALHRS